MDDIAMELPWTSPQKVGAGLVESGDWNGWSGCAAILFWFFGGGGGPPPPPPPPSSLLPAAVRYAPRRVFGSPGPSGVAGGYKTLQCTRTAIVGPHHVCDTTA